MDRAVARCSTSAAGDDEIPVEEKEPTTTRVLVRLVTRNDRVLSGPDSVRNSGKDLSVFHGQRSSPEHCISISKYLERIFKYTSCSPSCFVVGYIYMDRLVHRHPDSLVRSLNVHRLLLTTVMVAFKDLDDDGAAFIASSDGTIYLVERDPRQMGPLFSTSHALFSSYQEKHWKSKMELININIEVHEGVISFYFKEAEDVRKSKRLTTTKALIIRMNYMSYFYFPDIRELLEWNILVSYINWMHLCFKSEHDLKGRFPCSIKGVVYNMGEDFVLKLMEVESCENRVNSLPLPPTRDLNYIEILALIILLLLLVVSYLVVAVTLWHCCWKVPKSVETENEIIGDEGVSRNEIVDGDGEGVLKDEIVVGKGVCTVEGEGSTNDIAEIVKADEIVGSVPRKKISLETIIYNEYCFESSMKCIVDDYNGNIGSTHRKIYLSQREIAQGQNGTLILEGLHISHNHAIHVAVKRLRREDYYKSLQCKMSIYIPSHENINQCYDSEEDEEFVYLAMERCSYNLNEVIFTNMNLTGEILMRAMRDIITGLTHLHEHGYVHGDLKPENILFIITKNHVCAKVSLGNGNGCKNSGWCAPELINGEDITQINAEDITQKADMFSLGCLIYFWITGGWHPFGLGEEGIRNTINNNWDRRSLIRFPIAFHLVSVLLEHEKENRLGAKGALNHPYFWNLHKKSEFLREVHDWCKTKVPTTVELHVMHCLRNIESRVFSNYNWAKRLTPDLAHYLLPSKWAVYQNDNILDLIRAFRNLISRRKDLPAIVVMELNGDLQTDIYEYFETRFPNLLIEVYQVMYRECRQENTFRMYFSD